MLARRSGAGKGTDSSSLTRATRAMHTEAEASEGLDSSSHLADASSAEGTVSTSHVIDVEEDVEKADRKKDEIGQKSAVFMILRRFATGKS